MTVDRLGDLALAFSLRKRTTDLKLEIQGLNEELSTGVTSDISSHLSGSYARLTNVERNLRVLDGYKTTIAEAKLHTDTMQMELDRISSVTSEFTNDLIAANASNVASTRPAISAEAQSNFETIVASLNGQAAGRTLFGGDVADTAPLLDGTAILAELNVLVLSLTSAQDVQTAISDWFDDPAGFDTFAYSGGTNAQPAFQVAQTTSVSVDVRANDTAFKDTLKAFAYAALASEPSLSLSTDDQKALFQFAIDGMLSSQEDLTSLQAGLGLAQEQIENWSVRNETERVGEEFAKGALLEIDPYEAATRLEAAQFQLQSVYTVTVRLSEMSLVNYIR